MPRPSQSLLAIRTRRAGFPVNGSASGLGWAIRLKGALWADHAIKELVRFSDENRCHTFF
jgi:hypothetical protein